MTASEPIWVGVDVGGRRKGFHVAVLSADLRVVVEQCRDVESCVQHLGALAPAYVAIDSPSAWAETDEASRACERAFAKAGLCGIRYTPSAEVAARHPGDYYEWIEVGLELWDALRAAGIELIEGFPTASWTAWLGARRQRSRAAWTRGGLQQLGGRGIHRLESIRNQDQRDALAAALTARQHSLYPDSLDTFGDLVVPRPGTSPLPSGRGTS